MTDRPGSETGDRRPALRVVGPDEGAVTLPGSAVAVTPAQPIEVEGAFADAASRPVQEGAPAPDSAPDDEIDAADLDGDDGDGDGDHDGDGGDRDDLDGDGDGDGERDWAWVAEWRESNEPTPWATGLPLAAFAAVLAGVAIWVLSAGLADRPLLAVVLNLLVAGGLVPAMWLSRNLPVLRWFAAGAAVGVVGGWVAALMML